MKRIIQVETRAAVEGEEKNYKYKVKQRDSAIDATSKGQRYIKLSLRFGVWMSERPKLKAAATVKYY